MAAVRGAVVAVVAAAAVGTALLRRVRVANLLAVLANRKVVANQGQVAVGRADVLLRETLLTSGLAGFPRGRRSTLLRQAIVLGHWPTR